MLSSLLILFLLWSTGTILLILYTVDDESPRAKKEIAADLSPGEYTGLGGSLTRIEREFDGAELELHRAHLLASHKHSGKTERGPDGKLRWREK